MKQHAIPKSKAKTAYALLSEVAALIKAEPKRYNQTRFMMRQGDDYEAPMHGFPKCGTVGCVAGWVFTLKKPTPTPYDDIEGEAVEILGLDFGQSSELFHGGALLGTEPQTARHAKAGATHIRAFQKRYRAQLLAKKV